MSALLIHIEESSLLEAQPQRFAGGPPAAPSLSGIARLAAEGESLRQGHDVEYFTLPARSLLNRCVSKRKLPFTWTINPYRGCEFACKYCYARYTHEFMEMRDGVDFERKIYVKQQTAWLLRQELGKVKPGEEIAIGTATDPYQPAERRFEITRSILREMAQHRCPPGTNAGTFSWAFRSLGRILVQLNRRVCNNSLPRHGQGRDGDDRGRIGPVSRGRQGRLWRLASWPRRVLPARRRSGYG